MPSRTTRPLNHATPRPPPARAHHLPGGPRPQAAPPPRSPRGPVPSPAPRAQAPPRTTRSHSARLSDRRTFRRSLQALPDPDHQRAAQWRVRPRCGISRGRSTNLPRIRAIPHRAKGRLREGTRTLEGNSRPKALWSSIWYLTIEQRSEKPVELRGFEPLTFCMPCIPVSSDHIALGPIAAGESGFNVWGRLAQSGGIWGRWHLVRHWISGPPSRGASCRSAPRRLHGS